MSPGHYMTWRHSNWSWLIIVIVLLYIISILLLYISTQKYDMNAADLPKLYWRSLQDVILKRHATGHNTSKLVLKHWSHAQSCKSCLRFFAMSDKDSMRISSLVRFWFRTWKISCWVWTIPVGAFNLEVSVITFLSSHPVVDPVNGVLSFHAYSHVWQKREFVNTQPLKMTVHCIQAAHSEFLEWLGSHFEDWPYQHLHGSLLCGVACRVP